MSIKKQIKNKLKGFPWQVFSWLMFAQVVLILGTLIVAGSSARSLFKKGFLTQSYRQMENSLSVMAEFVDITNSNWCNTASQSKFYRITIVFQSGEVFCDSERKSSSMDNHINRPEIQSASTAAFGHSLRKSDTLHQEMLYSAIKIVKSDKTFYLRIASLQKELDDALAKFDNSLIFVLLIVMFFVIAGSFWIAKKFSSPLGKLLERIEMAKNNSPAFYNIANAEEQIPFGEWNELESSIETIAAGLRRNIDDLLNEREQQSKVLSAISDGILAVDKEGVALFFNSKIELFFRRSVGHKKQLILWELFRDPELLEAYQNALDISVSSEVTLALQEIDKSIRYFAVSITPLHKANGTVYGAVGIFHDITELKLIEQMRIDFVANVSHELRTPLTSIIGYSDSLMYDLDKGMPIDRKSIEVVHTNGKRLLALISDLLDLSDIESSAVLRRENTNTESITNYIIESLKEHINKRGQLIELVYEAKNVFADQHRLEQILTNLLDNASKYSGEFSTIKIIWQSIPNKNFTRLIVEDNGPGIPAEHHTRLFERFYRVDKARSRDQGGTGLGLAIVKHIMQRHNGSISVESKLGRGTKFICDFPISEKDI